MKVAPNKLPDQEALHRLLRYDHQTGLLYWKPRTASDMRPGRNGSDIEAVRWNTRFAGTVAMNSVGCSGYRSGRIAGIPYLAHRIIWKWMTGDDPSQIDHIDGNRLNNTWSNLRQSDHASNMLNKKLYSKNRSGCPGVTWHIVRRKWQVNVRINRKVQYLGLFSELGEAIRVRKAAERQAGYHPNHGRDRLP